MSNTPLSFSSLKRNRNAVEKLTQAVQQASQTRQVDERFWEPTVDKAGNGHALIRFLPAPPQDGEDGLPWVRRFNHSFQGPGGWFIDECPTTLEQKCPVCENNTVLWNSGIESNQNIVRIRKRKLTYIANILVISDPAKPENDGKVMLYKFGKKIFDKIYEKMHPEFPDEKAFSPFDLWDGANFKLKIRTVDKYRNYDKSEFATPAPVSTDDATLESLWRKEYSLKDFVSPKNFKTYDQLNNRLVKVLGTAPKAATAESSAPTVNEEATPQESFEEEAPEGEMAFFKELADQN